MSDSTHKIWLWVGIAVAVVVVAAIAFVLLGTAEVTVPAVTGMKSADAVRTLESAGFKLGATEQTVSTDTVAGTVLTQNPAGGTKAKKGASVDLTVAKPQDLISVPDVVGKESAAAADAIKAAGLEPALHSDYSTAAPAGSVYAQVPAAASQVLPGAQVVLGVSLGAAPDAGVAVPKVVGKTQADATSSLQKAGFVVQAQDGYSDTVAAGNVIAQLPAGGAKALPGSTVGISVSKGKATSAVTVPNVVGKSKSDAVAKLESAGLGADAYETYSATVAKGNVIGQIPAAGSKVAKGTVVGISVSLGKAPATVKVPDVAGKTAEEASKTITAAGLTPIAVEQSSDTVPDGVVIGQSPAARSIVEPKSTVYFAISTGPANKPTPY